MRCLLDKVTARLAVQGLLKLGEGQALANEVLASPEKMRQSWLCPPLAQMIAQRFSGLRWWPPAIRP